jgi:hypothetical protein
LSSPHDPFSAIYTRIASYAQFCGRKYEQPNVSLAWIAREMPIKQDDEREHYLEGFRRAGMR